MASGLVTSLTRLGDLAGGGGSGSGSQVGVPVPCSESGTVTVECVPEDGGSRTTYTFEGCRNVNEEAQVDAFIDGTIVQSTPDAGCFMSPPDDLSQVFIDVIADVDVSAGGRNISGNLDMFVDILTFDGELDIAFDAMGTLDCVGEFAAASNSIILQPDVSCPDDGFVIVTLPDGDSTIQFFFGFVDIDYDNDGTFDDSYESCENSLLATCQ